MMKEWVLTSTFLIVVVLCLRAILGKHIDARLKYAVWAVVLVRLLVPMQLFTLPLTGAQITQTVWPQVEQSAPMNVTTAADSKPGTESRLEPSRIPNDPPSRVDITGDADIVIPENSAITGLDIMKHLPQVLNVIWFGGAIVLALAFFVSNLHFAFRLRQKRVLLEMGDFPLRVYAFADLPSPCLFGLFHPAVYVMPEVSADSAVLHHVLAHELTHYRHLDHIWNLLRCAALCAHWWNPLVWLAAHLSRQDGEVACDAGALKRLGTGERAAYGNTLLMVSTAKARPSGLLHCSTGMSGGKKSLHERIRYIAGASKQLVGAVIAVVLILALACACSFGQASAGTEPLDSKEPTPTETQQLQNERQDSTDGPQGDVLPYTPDLNHNGIAETLVKGTFLDSNGMLVGERIEVWENGQMIWLGESDVLHNPQAMFLCMLDEKDYLLRYSPSMGRWYGNYYYQLFSLDENGEKSGQEKIVQENYLDFSIDFHSGSDNFEPAEIAGFMGEINGLLENSIQLWNTAGQLAVTFEGEGRLIDTLWWLDYSPQIFKRDENATLLENLEKYKTVRFSEVEGQPHPSWDSADEARAAYRAVLSNERSFINTDDGDTLTISQRLDQLKSGQPAEVLRFAVVDLDRDDTPEVILWIYAKSNEYWGFIILRFYDGEVYGYTKPYRAFQEVKTDGSYSIVGADSSTASFSETELSDNKLIYWEKTENSTDSQYINYYVEGKNITREEYLEAVEIQQEMDFAAWYTFTESSIKTIFQ